MVSGHAAASRGEGSGTPRLGPLGVALNARVRVVNDLGRLAPSRSRGLGAAPQGASAKKQWFGWWPETSQRGGERNLAPMKNCWIVLKIYVSDFHMALTAAAGRDALNPTP